MGPEVADRESNMYFCVCNIGRVSKGLGEAREECIRQRMPLAALGYRLVRTSFRREPAVTQPAQIGASHRSEGGWVAAGSSKSLVLCDELMIDGLPE